jgi:pantetheine-phosphate adenylyltransferase
MSASRPERMAVYPGSFDPITNGHLDVVRRGLVCFDRLVVAIATNVRKQGLFTVPERIELIRASLSTVLSPADIARVEMDSFTGLLVDYVRRRQVQVVLRGLRAVADFEYELQMANMNRKLMPEVETVFMMTGEEHFYLSSGLVKEVAQLGGDVTKFVSAPVVAALKHKFAGG